MVQVADNRSILVCRVLGAYAPVSGGPGFTVRVTVEKATPVEGWADLLAESVGNEYLAVVPAVPAQQLGGRNRWVVEVSLVGPRRIVIRRVVGEG